MNPTKMAEKQRFLAKTASEHPDHRFSNLYDLLHWDYWMHISAERVLARLGSQTDGVDGTTRDVFKKGYEGQMTALIDQLKRKTYEPQPVRRVYIPKHDGKKRPLGIPALRDRLSAVAEETLLTLAPVDLRGEPPPPAASQASTVDRRLVLAASSDGSTADLEFIAGSGDAVNIEDRIQQLQQHDAESIVEDETSMVLLKAYALSVRHQQFHGMDVITVRVNPPEAREA